MKEATITGVALFRYVDQDGGRRYARKGQTVEIPDDEYKRGKELGVFDKPPEPEPSGPTPPKPYSEMNVAESIEFLESLSAEERENYLDDEKRKGVLDHFDTE